MSLLTLTVNGVQHTLDVPPNRFLAEVLRYDLGLTGTKIGCNEAECGACTVIVNGRSVDSCIYPALKAQGAEVLTIEGVGADGSASPPGSICRVRSNAMRLLYAWFYHAGQNAVGQQP